MGCCCSKPAEPDRPVIVEYGLCPVVREEEPQNAVPPVNLEFLPTSEQCGKQTVKKYRDSRFDPLRGTGSKRLVTFKTVREDPVPTASVSTPEVANSSNPEQGTVHLPHDDSTLLLRVLIFCTAIFTVELLWFYTTWI